MNNKVVFITGASSGIGAECFKYLENKGYTVFGTTRKKDLLSNKMLYMDVQDEASIKSAVESIIRLAGRIDILVNNAGMGMGPF